MKEHNGLSVFCTLLLLLQVIAAEGEQKASHALKEAAEVIQKSPAALQVTQTLLAFCIHQTLLRTEYLEGSSEKFRE